ncbi:membrane protein [Streptomyces albireticuli]|uniref:Membrane protein n=1 Tax=Streptomyces albireticuli TaxID=1940 RepID=A0A1Z2L5R0_9ACTN|nr:gephyrin-like molybdotransferase receptor GlpR [Streptomyces albireticuli]ARZ69644.1 membrane protein [Streptomyces albireticuli]
MSSSGLIYAVIVGAWAAYLVPMWLRRQDELNEARPTERFSTAIRLLSGRAGMERRYAKDLEGRASDDAPAPAEPAEPEARVPEPDTPTEMVDVRPFAMPSSGPAAGRPSAAASGGQAPGSGASGAAAASAAAERARRSKVLARRRRTTVILFLAFTIGAVVAGVGGLAFLWVPAAPALLLSAYIIYLRIQERRRFAFTMDQRRAELAAQRLREGRPRPHAAAPDPVTAAAPVDTVSHPAPTPPPVPEPSVTADRRALVEQTDHAEWVDQQRDRRAGGEGWEPVPVPLPTYVTAPVAPRGAESVDLGAPDTWSSARSSTAEPAAAPAPAQERRPARGRRRPRERGRTPLFDQYAEDGRPRAANE